jgi:hypothetical protein
MVGLTYVQQWLKSVCSAGRQAGCSTVVQALVVAEEFSFVAKAVVATGLQPLPLLAAMPLVALVSCSSSALNDTDSKT